MRLPPADQAVREQAATRLDKNIFLDAGAGCGKTHALTSRYMALVDAGLEIPEIIAVTFTTKAAREMKARLRGLFNDRARQAAADPSQVALWQRRARQLENAPISTIHSFCSSLLRRHALRAGLDPAFEVMEGVQQSLGTHEAIRNSLLRRLDEEHESAARAVADLGLQGAMSAIRRLLTAREEQQRDLDQPPTTGDLLQRWEGLKEDIQSDRLGLLTRSRAWRDNVQTLETRQSRDPADKLEALRRDILEIVDDVENEQLPVQQRYARLAQLGGLGNAPRSFHGWDPDDIEPVKRACASLKNKSGDPGKQARALAERVEPNPEPSAQLTAALYLEAHHALREFQQAKDAQAQLDYDDLQILTRDLLRDHADVRRDCHERYRHVLIDEFQDTNALQRELLWLVAGGDGASAPPPGRLFIVGDAKQSIYRFRDADVTVFDTTRAVFEMQGALRLRLEVTFRSHPGIVAAHNALFADPCVMGPDGPDRQSHEAFYEPLQAHRPLAAGDIFGTLLLTELPTKASAEQLREAEAMNLARWLADAIGRLQVFEPDGEGGERARPSQPKDFALLFRVTSDLRIYERALRMAGLRYHVSAGRGFFTRQEILDLVSLLSALENRHNEIALAGALRSPLFGLSDETLYWLKASGDRLHSALHKVRQGAHPHQADIAPEELPLAQFAAEQLEQLRALKNRLPLSSLLSEILKRTGYTAALAGLFDGDQSLANIRRFQEFAAGFTTAGNCSLRDFVDYIGDLVDSEERFAQAPVSEEDDDCIKLMTVHAAKGLEWPIVIVPDLARAGRPNSEVWRYHRRHGLIAAPEIAGERPWPLPGVMIKEQDDSENEAEMRRLLYVALTRCRDHFVLSSALGHASGQNNWLAWLMRALGLEEHQETCSVPQVRAHFCGLPEATPPQKSGDAQRSRGIIPAGLAARLRPVPLDHALLRRFTVTALSSYRACPACYRLRYLEGLADTRGLAGGLSVEAGQLLATERGDIIHAALELIGRDGPAQAPEALRQALGSRTVEEAALQDMLERIRWYLSQPVYASRIAGADNLRSEVPVAFELQGAVIEGKIDAVAETAGVLCALDYKTGYETEGEADETHIFQLGLYCAGLRALGKQATEAHVVYLDRGEIVAVKEADIAAAQEQAERAIRGIHEGAFECRRSPACERCGLRWACS